MSDQTTDQPEDSGHGDPPPKKPPTRMAIPTEPLTSSGPAPAPTPADEKAKK